MKTHIKHNLFLSALFIVLSVLFQMFEYKDVIITMLAFLTTAIFIKKMQVKRQLAYFLEPFDENDFKVTDEVK